LEVHPSEVGKRYVEVEISLSYQHFSDWAPSPELVKQAERDKAATLGANGIIFNHLPGGREILYDDALAIFIPEDRA